MNEIPEHSAPQAATVPPVAPAPPVGQAVPASAGAPPTPPKPPPPVAKENYTGGWAACAILGLTIVMVVVGWNVGAGYNVALIALLMLVVFLILGISITKQWLGILINERNLMSLSRLQMAVWTIVVLSAYFGFAVVRIRAMSTNSWNGHRFSEFTSSVQSALRAELADPLNVALDPHLWVLLGISTASLVGTPLILSTKKDKKPDDAAATKAAASAAAALKTESVDEIKRNSHGTLYANSNISDARFTDMFQGDEVINTAQIDLAKVQMFFFTVVAAVCFFFMVFEQVPSQSLDVGQLAATTDPKQLAFLIHKYTLGQLPVLPDGLVAILGISHAGYLTSKSVNHTPGA